VTAQRAVDAPDRRLLIGGGILLVMLAFAFLRWPGLIAVPLAIVAGWTGIAMLVTALRSASRRLRRAGWQHTEYASTPRQR
jgi:hypothetical protein